SLHLPRLRPSPTRRSSDLRPPLQDEFPRALDTGLAGAGRARLLLDAEIPHGPPRAGGRLDDEAVLVPQQGVGDDEALVRGVARRSEEHTSELQSRENLVCR